MPIAMIMPKVDMDQATGTVVEWLKKDGDPVKQGEIILIIETDKVSIEVESPGTGILQGISAKPGDVVPIAETIAYILQPGEALPQAAAPANPPASTPPVQPQPVEATPVARNIASLTGVDLAGISGSGPRGRITKADVESVISSAPSPAAGNGKGQPVGDGKVNATPAARRIARQQGVALPEVDGSGPGGRIQAADVLAFRPAVSAAPQGVSSRPAPEVEIVPLVGMRRTIAERMVASYQTIPHITFTSRVNMTRFNALRTEFNTYSERTGAGRVSATAMLVRIIGAALARHPWLNSSLYNEEIRLRKDINIGVAVALEAGLIVPVVRDANHKGVAAIAAEVDDLAARARDGKLIPSDVSDGTFTLSNLGPFGIEQFTALINPPQAGILAVGMTQMEAVPDAAGEIRAVPVMHMTLSADHRVVDGAVAARFMADLKSLLENPALLLW